MKTVFVFLNAGGSGIAATMLADDASKSLRPVDINPAETTESTEYIAVLAGCDVVSRRLELPEMSLGKQRRILPSLYDEFLAYNDDGNHLAIISMGAGEDAMILCVNTDVVSAALQSLADMGLEPKSCIADYFLCDVPEGGEARPWGTPTGMLAVRNNDGTGFSMEPELARELLSQEDDDIDSSCVLSLEESIEYNILQGNFERKVGLVGYATALRRFTYVAGFALLLFGVGYHMKTLNIEERAHKLSEETDSVFREAFPEVTRVIEPAVQGGRIVSQLKSESGGVFMRLSETVFRLVKNHDGLIVRGVRFNQEQNAYFLTVVADNFSVSDAFRQSLVSAGLTVTEGGSRQEAGKVISDIAIEVRP